jgi:hypothetical protein
MFVAVKIRQIILNEHCFMYLDIRFQTPIEYFLNLNNDLTLFIASKWRSL